MTPAWMLQDEIGLCPCGCIGKRRKANFIDKTIVGASSLVRQALFTDDIAAQPGLLQRIDPRVKAISLLALVVTALQKMAVQCLHAPMNGLRHVTYAIP